MANRSLLKREGTEGGTAERDGAPLGGTRAEATQRLQIGLSGLAAMVLLVGLANIIQGRAQSTDDTAVPQAAPTTEPTEAPQQSDPLADAGIVPDIAAEPEPEPADLPPLEGDPDAALIELEDAPAP